MKVLDELKRQIAASDEAGWDWGDHGYVAAHIDALIAVAEAVQEARAVLETYIEDSVCEKAAAILDAALARLEPEAG